MGWYEHRWIVEDYHQCLKTGCRLEERQVQTAARLIRLLGLLAPLAVRLLQLRDLARRDPERPECLVLDADWLAIVAAQTGQVPACMTTEAECSAVAQMGGYLALKARWPSRVENPVEGLAARPNAVGGRSSSFSSPFVICV